jgi:hypothetical protein
MINNMVMCADKKVESMDISVILGTHKYLLSSRYHLETSRHMSVYYSASAWIISRSHVVFTIVNSRISTGIPDGVERSKPHACEPPSLAAHSCCDHCHALTNPFLTYKDDSLVKPNVEPRGDNDTYSRRNSGTDRD